MSSIALRDALLRAGLAVFTPPANAGPGPVEHDPGFAGFSDPPAVRRLVTIGTPWQGGFAADYVAGLLPLAAAAGDTGTEQIMTEFAALAAASSRVTTSGTRVATRACGRMTGSSPCRVRSPPACQRQCCRTGRSTSSPTCTASTSPTGSGCRGRRH